MTAPAGIPRPPGPGRAERPRIFILKPSSLGDVIQALPVLRLIKRHLPASEIFWWIDSGLAPLLEGDPDLTGLIEFPRRRWASVWHWGEACESVRRVRDLRFDWVIDLQSLLRSAVMAWLANGSATIGLDDPREGARGFYDVAVPRPSEQTHAVDWYLQVLPHLGVPADQPFTWLPRRPRPAEEIAERWHPAEARWIAVQPGARWENKRWPASSFRAALIRLAQLLPEFHFAILGSEGDRPLGEALAEAVPGRCLDLTGRTSLPQMIEWLRVCELLITNDTGPMHVADALGKPVVAMFGPTDPRRTGPYSQRERALHHSLPCAPCLKDTCRWSQPLECLRALTPERVVEEVLARLDQVAASTAP